MSILLLGLLCMVGVCMGQPQPTDNYPHKATLDAMGQVSILYWKVDSTHITFELQGKTTGWIGVGISPNGGMMGADIYIGWVKDGVAKITDRHGDPNQNAYPPLDAQQNVELLGGSECNGWTVVTFQRQIAACDGSDDITITSSTQRIIWAVGTEDPDGADSAPSDYHGNMANQRGTKSLLLLEGNRIFTLPSDEPVQSFDLLNDNFPIPPMDTYYNCRLMKVPELSSKHHVVKIEPIIQPENQANVHHMIIDICDYDTLESESVLNTDEGCFGSNMPPDFRRCSQLIHAWAIGGETLYYPEHVGLPIGTSDGPKYIVMETHYDNPARVSGKVDSSGFRITYTSRLRQYDAGVLEVGHLVVPIFQLIPPNANSFLQYGECNSGCMAAGMEVNQQSDIKLFGVGLHTHLLGRGLTLRHIGSDGKELPYIAQDNNYDFNYQEGKIFPQEVVFNSGDSMQLVCNYDSTSRKNFTFAGISTYEEMCLAFVFYYPKIPINKCRSYPLPDYLYAYFGATSYSLSSSFYSPETLRLTIPGQPPNQPFLDVISQYNWDQEIASNFSDYLLSVWNGFSCRNTTATNLPIPAFGPPLNISEVYTPPVPTCIQPNTGMPISGGVDVCPTSAPGETTTSTAPLAAVHSFVLMATALVVMAFAMI